MALRLVVEHLAGCSGCELAWLDAGLALRERLDQVDLVRLPLLADLARSPDGRAQDLGPVDAALVSGALRTTAHLALAQELRARAATLVAVGTCAAYGGPPALANLYSLPDLQTDLCPARGEEVPPLLPQVFALEEKVKVDLALPGCPPHPDYLVEVLAALAAGRAPGLPQGAVCEACPTQRQGKGQVKSLRRFLANLDDPNRPLDQTPCLLEAGLLCLGPVTRAGCGGRSGPPRCLVARTGCRGCAGPARPGGNPLLDLLAALAANGLSLAGLPDKPGLLAFAGAQGRLRPARRAKAG